MPKGTGKTSATSMKQTRAATEASEEAIRRRAYELYLERGGAHGSPLDDWLRAEHDIPAKHPRKR